MVKPTHKCLNCGASLEKRLCAIAYYCYPCSCKRSAAQMTAMARVQIAVRDGLLQRQPCEVCGSTHRIHAHHDDYSQPLKVRWLCPRHHRQLHVAQYNAAIAQQQARDSTA